MRTDSDSDNDMAAEDKRSHEGHGKVLLKRIFSAKKTSWSGWWYEAAGHWRRSEKSKPHKSTT